MTGFAAGQIQKRGGNVNQEKAAGCPFPQIAGSS